MGAYAEFTKIIKRNLSIFASPVFFKVTVVVTSSTVP